MVTASIFRSNGTVRMMPSLAHPSCSCAPLTGQTKPATALATQHVSACCINGGVPSAGQARWLRSWCVPQNFLYPQRDQPLLLPVDMREWLPEDDLVFVVLDAVAMLDLGEFRRLYLADGHGRAAFDPEMMEALLLHG